MRISDRILVQNTLQSLRTNLEAVERAQRESTTGRRIQSVSDDPVDASTIIRIAARLRDVDQFRRNSIGATTRLSTEDAVLNTVNDLMTQAKGFAAGAAVDDPNDPTRLDALEGIREIVKQVIALGNTKIGDEYIFAGARTDAPAFQSDGTYQGDGTVHRVEIDEQMVIDTNHTGDTLLGRVLHSLQYLEQELQNGNAESIRATQNELTAAQEGAVANQAQVGARLREIENVGTHLTNRTNVLLDQREALRDVDPTEAAVRLLSAQNALDRAYAVVSRVIQTSILNYLK